MVCDYHLGQRAEIERAVRQGRLTSGEASMEQSYINEEMKRCCP